MNRRIRAAALAAAFALVAPAIAAAQTPSLVGVWSHHVVDQRTGQDSSVIWDEFDANGQLHMRVVNAVQTIDYYGVYQLLNGGTVVRAQFNDFEPKQLCTMICSPITPQMQMGQPGDSALRFDGPNVVYFGADMYTRQQ
jgi:hypothetical protein